MKNILVPTDFSETSEQALRVGADLAKKVDGKLFVLHVMEIPSYQEEHHVFMQSEDVPEGLLMMKQVHKRFEELFKKDFMKGVNAVEAIQFERTYENIVKQAREKEMDLIIMGTHGASGLKEVFMGSNTERVIRKSDVPVLTVKNAFKVEDVETFVFASDFNPEVYGRFKKIDKLAELFKAHIYLLKVNTPNNFERSSESYPLMREFARHFGLTDYTMNIYNDETVEQGILSFSDEVGADVIALETHGRSGFSHMVNGSLAENVANHSERPVLSVKMEKE